MVLCLCVVWWFLSGNHKELFPSTSKDTQVHCQKKRAGKISLSSVGACIV
ncbi:hypothetical protein PVAP13_6KG015350 [Panicum virgatum]|uniref:Uncharacterized protein n=1 Tax=Panicum virgatum TaxID=38727 RepID=A0A8T0R7S7_PANVG|nr:hypothetical protein PVAP13_6KG015350 [Panicum virgatum]